MGRHALVLGTATFHADRALQPLPSVRHDVGQVKSMLDEAGCFDSVDAHVDLPREQLTGVLEDFFGARRNGDLALLYYSGHGLMMDGLDRESVFLAASDTVRSQLHATAVDTDGVLRHLLNITRASQKVVLLDCCFSGAFTARDRFRGGVRAEPRRGIRERGTFILTSSTHVRASKVQGTDRPSVFTDSVLRGLRGEAGSADGDGWITTNDLARYVQSDMKRHDAHTPVESSEGVTEPIRLVLHGEAEPDERSGTGVRRTLGGDDDVFDVDRWRRLAQYYISCMERAAALETFLDVTDPRKYKPMTAGPEPVLSGLGERALPPDAAAFARGVTSAGNSLLYGYPVVVLRPGQASQPVVTPLLLCDASVSDDGRLHTTAPRPNEALARELGLSDPELDELVRQVEETYVPGDPKALVATVRQLMAVLDLSPVTPIDPRELTGSVTTGPLHRVQNSGILYAAAGGGGPQRNLVRDLREQIGAKPASIRDTALGTLAEPVLDDGSDPSDSELVLVAPDRLNEAQERVIRAAMSRRLTVAQGPPGTGKSQLVTALVATATAAGQTVLVGSTNNRAVDEVCERVTAAVGPGLVVRTGNRDYQGQEPKLLTDLLVVRQGTEVADESTAKSNVRIAGGEISRLRDHLDARRLLERDMAELAAERLLESSGGHLSDPLPGPSGGVGSTVTALPDDDDALVRLVRLADRALRRGLLGWWARRRLRTYGLRERQEVEDFAHRVTVELRWRFGTRQLADLPDELHIWRRLTELIGTERPENSKQLLRAQIARRARAGATVIQQRCDEMSKPSPQPWQGFRKLLRYLPAWAVTTMSARAALQSQPALFDLVVIDEAAQCTIPAVLPMLYRAKRALIIGDPRQLAPVVTLPQDEEPTHQSSAGLGARWLAEHRLTYTRHSAFDAFSLCSGEVHLLDEHYRCHPDIIAEPNRQVYQGRLTVLTDPSRLKAPAERAVRWHHVPGSFSHGNHGSGYNEPELTEVLAEVRRLCAAYPHASVGVVTPLAPQNRRLTESLAAHSNDVVCGTVHRFQGGERDIMVVSPAGADGVPDGTRKWLVHQTNLWNVAITRARSQLVIVGDRSWWRAQSGLLAGLARGQTAEDTPTAPTARVADRVHAALRKHDVVVRRDVSLGGHRYDIVASCAGGSAQVAVLVDDPHGDSDGRILRKVLARLDVTTGSVPTVRAPVWQCLSAPDEISERVLATLAQLDRRR